MEFIKKIIVFFDAKMETPTTFSWFHLLFVALCLVACVLAILYAKKCNLRKVKIILIVCALVMIVLEVYKQLNYTFSVQNDKIVADYQWYAFPFQLCATPMYVMLLAGLCKSDKLHKSLVAYLCTFCFFGGICVMIYPNDVFIPTIGINIQTMIHHGMQLIIPCFLFSYYRDEINIKFFLKSLPVFACLITIAMAMNLLAPLFTTESFNMFYISPHFPCTLPVLSILYEKVPYGIFLATYVLAFCFASFVIYILAYASKKLAQAIKKGKSKSTKTVEN